MDYADPQPRAASSPAGTVLDGRYQVIELAGVGSNGAVYICLDKGDEDCEVSVKVTSARGAGGVSFRVEPLRTLGPAGGSAGRRLQEVSETLKSPLTTAQLRAITSLVDAKGESAHVEEEAVGEGSSSFVLALVGFGALLCLVAVFVVK